MPEAEEVPADRPESTDFYLRGAQRALKEAQTREQNCDTVRYDELCPRHLALAVDGFSSQGASAVAAGRSTGWCQIGALGIQGADNPEHDYITNLSRQPT